MAALFPRWSTTALRAGLGVLFAAAVLAVATPMTCVRSPDSTGVREPVEQPVSFDHRHHVGDDGVNCLYCHADAERAPTAGVPPTGTCMGCHAQIWPGSPMLEPVRRSWATGTPIPWTRVNAVPDHVYFDHSVHVGGGIGCVTCHGRVDQMAEVHQSAPLTMQWCLACHREPEPHLRPLDRIADMEWRPEGDPRQLGRALAAELGTRRLTHCSACHR